MQSITTEQIKQHRKERKESGVVGCLKGISWRPEDPMNPECFCHDCRTTWDPEGDIDLALIKSGYRWACETYASLIPDKKEILSYLRCKTDDALEDFVKAQMELSQKTHEIRDLQQAHTKKAGSYASMSSGSYTFLKTYEHEIDRLSSEMDALHQQILYLTNEEVALETQCEEAGRALSSARQTEREFLETNF